MLIKVFKNGKIEEYPNAHITWEWDDETGELGPDSGWRISSFDKNNTHVNAFIRPRDCDKIEISHEESDRVFESPKGISAKAYRSLIELVKNMRDEQKNYNSLPLTADVSLADALDKVLVAQELVDEFLATLEVK